MGLFCSPRGRWSSGAAEVTAESSWMGSPAPPPSQGPLLGAGVDEGISLISKITASYAEQEKAIKTKGS